MSQKDRIKWENKYKQNPNLLEIRPPSGAVVKYFDKCSGNMALDLACGAGRNTLFLEEKGFYIDAVDISETALKILAGRIKSGRVNIISADLDSFSIDKKYDLIIKCNYLDRELINRAKEALKSGGVMVVESYVEDDENQKRDSNPAFLLNKGELPGFFKRGFEILEYNEFWNESYEKYRMKKAFIAVKKY